MNDIINAYLNMCLAFKESDMWNDKEALEAFNSQSPEAIGYNYPMLLLYRPLSEACAFLRTNTQNTLSNDNIIWLMDIVNDIWYSLDCRRDVWRDTSDCDIKLGEKYKNILFRHFNIEKNRALDRDLLRFFSGELWTELLNLS